MSLRQAPAASTGGPVDLPAGPLAEAVRDAVARPTPAEALRAAIDIAVHSGPGDAASITMLVPRRTLGTVAHSDQRVRDADHLQYALGEGPSLDAVRTKGVVIVPDLLADGRWPRWAPRAADLGIGASISVHLFTNTALGSLNLYSQTPQDYDHSDIETARILAAHASVVLAYTRTEQNLWQAVDARNLIGQAQGILMARYHLTAPAAFAVLRRHSQRHNIKIAVLAEQLTTTGHLPGLNTTKGAAVMPSSPRRAARSAADWLHQHPFRGEGPGSRAERGVPSAFRTAGAPVPAKQALRP